MTTLIDIAFSTAGAPRAPREARAGCPSDETFAGYLDGLLSATEHRHLEDHALACGDCLLMVKASAAVRGALEVPAPARLSVVARLLQAGLELLNPLDVTIRSLGSPGAAPALGGVRGAATEVAEVISIEGPGRGLDELQLQIQPNGHVRLQVSGDAPPPVHAGEISSVVLEVDGAPREKRPFSGAPLAFAPLAHGRFRVRLVARAPGREGREISEASIELRA